MGITRLTLAGIEKPPEHHVYSAVFDFGDDPAVIMRAMVVEPTKAWAKAGAVDVAGEFEGKYCSPCPEVRLQGGAIELNARLFEAMAAEGVPVRSQGDTLQFLLEELGASLRQSFERGRGALGGRSS